MDNLIAYFEAVRLHQQGKVTEAIQLYRQVVAQHPQFSPALANLGALVAATESAQEGAELLKRAIEADNNNIEAWMNLGMMMVQGNQKDQAAHCFAQVVKVSPGHTDALYQLGMLRADAGNMQEAMQYCQAAVTSNPAHGPAHAALGWVLLEQGKVQEAIKILAHATKLAPNDFNSWVLYGNACRDAKLVREAAAAYRKALELQPGHRDVQRNLARVLQAAVPAWHHGMLADTGRNDAFQQAIERAVTSDSIVLDIGTGSGLLALMAARAGAKQVYACEMVPELADAARQAVQDNGFADRITVFSKKSTDLNPDSDFEDKPNLVVSEILDVGLLGEMVWPSVRHARAVLLAPGAQAIPQGATVHAVAVQVPNLRQVSPIKTVSGFDLSAFDRFRVPGEYERAFLSREPHTKMTDPFVVGDFNLSQPPPAIHDNNPLVKSFELQATTDGAVHGILFWFDLHLDNETTASSGPEGDMVHWGQAMCYFEEDLQVKAGESFSVKMRLTDALIRFEVG